MEPPGRSTAGVGDAAVVGKSVVLTLPLGAGPEAVEEEEVGGRPEPARRGADD